MYEEMYKNGMSLRNIEKETGISRKIISKELKNKSYNIKKRSSGTTGQSKYSYDKTIFTKIDTDEKAYWLGFLYADGYIGKNTVEFCLAEKDKEMIYLFKKFMKSNHPIKIKVVNGFKQYRITICSIDLVTQLTNLNCFNNKSLSLEFPSEEIIPEKYINHFMRGYFDGDGCFYISQKTAHVSIIGTKEFLLKYKKILENIGMNNNKLRHGNCGKAYELRYGGNKQYKIFYDFLYENSSIHLKRKVLPTYQETDK